ncbi:hypothetical protein AK812_SmicGene15868 [Symbiodinium microadriaticum]|uniref:Uncharacterized protein n=1 Tax=Symbiodinium microadriaticum TaxID=2951 RepID=A0A1Q9E1V0_SYMMI|nr:hypothetical protein AK812_SmicGene15868 [Symbiodinium microadriaticum]
MAARASSTAKAMDVPDVEEAMDVPDVEEEGFAVLRGALPPESAAELRSAVEAEARRLLAEDPLGKALGGFGALNIEGSESWMSGRYAVIVPRSGHEETQGSVARWAQLLDLPSLTPVLEAAFSGDYIAVGGGGDFVLGETATWANDTHQRLHVDLQLPEMYDKAQLRGSP